MASKMGDDWSGSERRRESRANVALTAQIEAGGKTYLGEIQSLSVSGVYVQLMDADPFPHEGDALLVTSDLAEPLHVGIRVKRKDDHGFVVGLGLEFLALTPTAREYLERAGDATG